VDGKPRLRIFCNQETEELTKGSDFISPQPYMGGDSKFEGFLYPSTDGAVPVSGTAQVIVNVDATGNLKGAELKSEYPPLLGFGDAALAQFRSAKFIPAYRDGKPVESKTTLTVSYEP
jgi:TonB family protein